MGGSGYGFLGRFSGPSYVSPGWRRYEREQARERAGLAQRPNMANRLARKAKRSAQRRARY